MLIAIGFVLGAVGMLLALFIIARLTPPPPEQMIVLESDGEHTWTVECKKLDITI
jgi:hypothetical protein